MRECLTGRDAEYKTCLPAFQVPFRGGIINFAPGLRFMVGAAFFFSLMSVCVKLAGERLPTPQIVFARSLFSLILTAWMLRRARVSPWGNRKPLLVLRGLLGFGGLLAFFHAITALPLADVTVLHYTNPVLTALLAGVVLGERLLRRDLAGLALGLAGVVCVAQPQFLFGGLSNELDLRAVGIALVGAVASALAYTTVRALGRTEHHLVVVFYFPLVATPASLPFLAGNLVWPTPFEWVMLVGVAVTTQIAQVLLTRGLHSELAGRAMSMSYIQIVFATVWGLLLFGERPGWLTLMGALLVVLGTLTVAGARPWVRSPHGTG